MRRVMLTRDILAPADAVFRALTDIDVFAQKNPDIIKVDLLSDRKTGVGARFREHRRMGAREAATELECTDYVENESVRFVADQGGAVWDSVFTLKPSGRGTTLTLEMEARPHSVMAKLATPMMMGMVSKAVARDMDAVKTYCEGGGPAGAGGGW